jgi:hypothetical protein
MSRSPRPGATALAALLAGALPFLASTPHGASAQLTDPCGAGCGVLLGASAVSFAIGTSVAVGRSVGGFQTMAASRTVWATSFTAVMAGGVALSGDGHRQQRAVRGSALGAVGGALAGLAVESLTEDSTPTTRFAAALIGAAAGVLVGGAIGALTHEGSSDPPDSFAPELRVGSPTFSVRVPF